MPYVTRIPQVISRASLQTQRAVELAGQEVEFHAASAVSSRRRSGFEQSSMKWRPSRNPYVGYVNAGAFYTRFSEYGSVHQSAKPVLGPAAELVRDSYEAAVAGAWQDAARSA